MQYRITAAEDGEGDSSELPDESIVLATIVAPESDHSSRMNDTEG